MGERGCSVGGSVAYTAADDIHAIRISQRGERKVVCFLRVVRSRWLVNSAFTLVN